MNKYSSKAVKTAATVGMSLAMVLGNVAPVINTTMTTFAEDSTVTATDLIKSIEAVLNGEGFAYDGIKNVPLDTVADWSGSDPDQGLGTFVSENFDVLSDYVNYGSGESNEITVHLVGTKDDSIQIRDVITELETALDNLNKYFGEEGSYVKDDLNDSQYEEVLSAWETIDKYYDTYKGNLRNSGNNEGKASIRRAYYSDFFETMVEKKEDYEDSFLGDFVDKYVTELKSTPIGETKVTVSELVDKDADFSYKNLSELEDFVKDLKNDDIEDLAGIIKYSKVEDDEEVAEYVDRLEEIVDEIKEVKEMIKSTNSVVKDYKEVASDVADLAEEVKKYDEDDTTEFDKDFNKFRSEDIQKLQAYVTDVVENFFVVDVVKRTNGNYSLRLKDADYARYLDAKTTVVSSDLETLLTTNLDKDSDESVYDMLVDQVTSIETLIEAVTTDIEDITLSTNLTTAQASKIIAAKKAYDKLTDTEGEYWGALTTKEKKAIEANKTLIETLYFKLILNGSVTASGWVDKGNGDWDYINEDGTRSTKWVAAGSDWYYVKNGTMLRNSWIASDAQGTRWYYVDDAGKMVYNTTINGYTFNPYGVWVQ